MVSENNTQKASTTKCSRANLFKILTKFCKIPVKKLAFWKICILKG